MIRSDASACACVGGPTFYRYRDVDDRSRCTTCEGLSLVPRGQAIPADLRAAIEAAQLSAGGVELAREPVADPFEGLGLSALARPELLPQAMRRELFALDRA